MPWCSSTCRSKDGLNLNALPHTSHMWRWRSSCMASMCLRKRWGVAKLLNYIQVIISIRHFVDVKLIVNFYLLVHISQLYSRLSSCFRIWLLRHFCPRNTLEQIWQQTVSWLSSFLEWIILMWLAKHLLDFNCFPQSSHLEKFVKLSTFLCTFVQYYLNLLGLVCHWTCSANKLGFWNVLPQHFTYAVLLCICEKCKRRSLYASTHKPHISQFSNIKFPIISSFTFDASFLNTFFTLRESTFLHFRLTFLTRA